MDLTSPISSVVPSAHGPVLAVLARTTEPLSGRRVAALTDGRVGQWRTNEVLRALADAGIVLREHRPPANLYRLNRDHVAAPGIIALAEQWTTLIGRIREDFQEWTEAPLAACMFGPAARGQASSSSDIDILLVRTDGGSTSDGPQGTWFTCVEQLREKVWIWSGNSTEIVELSGAELGDAVTRDDRLIHDLRQDAIPLAGHDIRSLLRPSAARR